MSNSFIFDPNKFVNFESNENTVSAIEVFEPLTKYSKYLSQLFDLSRPYINTAITTTLTDVLNNSNWQSVNTDSQTKADYAKYIESIDITQDQLKDISENVGLFISDQNRETYYPILQIIYQYILVSNPDIDVHTKDIILKMSKDINHSQISDIQERAIAEYLVSNFFFYSGRQHFLFATKTILKKISKSDGVLSMIKMLQTALSIVQTRSMETINNI